MKVNVGLVATLWVWCLNGVANLSNMSLLKLLNSLATAGTDAYKNWLTLL